jgi:hypothetical protein
MQQAAGHYRLRSHRADAGKPTKLAKAGKLGWTGRFLKICRLCRKY